MGIMRMNSEGRETAPPSPSSTLLRIVHLSDLHLTSRDEAPRSEVKLFGRLRGMNANFRRLVRAPIFQEPGTRILVTGDVTDRGDIGAWKVFWNALNAMNLTDRTIVVPGNHDVGCLGLSRGFGADGIDQALAGLRLGEQPVRFPWAKKLAEGVVMFGLNSNNLRGASMAGTATGELDYHEMGEFARLLRAHRAASVKLVVLHHSPNIVGQDTARRQGLPSLGAVERLTLQIPQSQRRTLRLLCLSNGVKAIFHGHVHLEEDRTVAGVRIIGARAVTEPLPGGALSFASYAIRSSGILRRRVHRVTP